MTNALFVRIPLVAAIIALAVLVCSPMGTTEAQARGSKPKAAAVKKGSSKKSKGSGRVARRSSKRRHVARRYTVRGNPEVTRVVASTLLVEKLPELAALVGLQAPPRTDGMTTAGDAVPEKAVMPTRSTAAPMIRNSYDDSEVNETEDSDGITAADYEELEELPTDINTFYKEFTKYMAGLNGEPTITDNGVDKVAVMEALVDWMGTRYLFGGMGRNGIDCSAFTGTIYRALNFKLPRTAAMQWEVGLPVERDDLQFGDLVFFHTRAAVYVSHVGMYLGNGLFAHASSRNGVTVSPLDATYYSTHYIGGRRFDLNAAMAASTESEVAAN